MNVNLNNLMNIIYDILKILYYCLVFWAIEKIYLWLSRITKMFLLSSNPNWVLPSFSFFKLNKKNEDTSIGSHVHTSIGKTLSSRASQTEYFLHKGPVAKKK